jgi:hypothetical protein
MAIPKKKAIASIVVIIICAIAAIFFVKRDADNAEKSIEKSPQLPPGPAVEHFSFLDLNSQSRITNEIKQSLNDKLGPDAYETKTTIDLELQMKGFLARYVPEIDALNRELNYLPGERVEHDTIQLTFRYARNKNAPFDYVRMIFSGETGAPLFFKIQAKQEGASVLDSIQSKYGSPTVQEWGDEKSKLYSWERQGDLLLICESQSRSGRPLLDIGFYFTSHIQSLIKKEQANRLQRSKNLEKTGQTAF